MKENQIVKRSIDANGHGLVLRSIEDMYRFAQAVVKSNMAPSSFKSAEQVMIAIQCGAELGMTPMKSLQSLCVVGGNARLWGDAPLALVRQSGNLEYIKEEIDGDIGIDLKETSDDVKAVCETKRKGDPNSIIREFSVGDARRAGLWNKSTFKGNASVWMQYPKRMLQMRARALNLRDSFPDCFSGATIAEEYMDMPEPAFEPDTPRRNERKQVESEQKDNAILEEIIKDVYGIYSGVFSEADNVEGFAEFCSSVLGGEPTDFTCCNENMDTIVNIDAFNDDNLKKLKERLVEINAEEKFGQDTVREEKDSTDNSRQVNGPDVGDLPLPGMEDEGKPGKTTGRRRRNP